MPKELVMTKAVAHQQHGNSAVVTGCKYAISWEIFLSIDNYHISHTRPVTDSIDQDESHNDNMCIGHCLGDPVGTPFFSIDVDSELPLQSLSPLVHQ